MGLNRGNIEDVREGRKWQIFAYANNHYAGHVPATVEMFQELWRRQVKTEIMKTKQAPEQGQLFN